MTGVIIVSRHEGTVSFLKKLFPEARVIQHLNDPGEIPEGAMVFGNLPIHIIEQLLRRGCRFFLVSLEVPRELRGQDLPEDTVAKYIRIYEVADLKLSEFIIS